MDNKQEIMQHKKTLADWCHLHSTSMLTPTPFSSLMLFYLQHPILCAKAHFDIP